MNPSSRQTFAGFDHSKGSVATIAVMVAAMLAFLTISFASYKFTRHRMLINFLVYKEAQIFITNHPQVVGTIGTILTWDRWPSGHFSYSRKKGTGWLRIEVAGARDRGQILLEFSSDDPKHWNIDRAMLKQSGYEVPIVLIVPSNWWQSFEQYLNWGQLDEAQQVCNLIGQVVPNHINSVQCRADIALATGDTKKYIRLFESLVASDNKYFRYHEQLGTAYMKAGMLSKGLEHLTRAWRLRPEPQIAATLGGLYTILERFEESRFFLNEALKGGTASPVVMFTYGSYYAKRKDYSKAVETFQKVLSINPNYAEAYIGLGGVAVALGQANDAVFYYEQALNRKPFGLLSSRMALVDLLIGIGHIDSAAYHLFKAMIYHPDHHPIYEKLQTLYQKQGDLVGARVVRELWKRQQKRHELEQ